MRCYHLKQERAPAASAARHKRAAPSGARAVADVAVPFLCKKLRGGRIVNCIQFRIRRVGARAAMVGHRICKRTPGCAPSACWVNGGYWSTHRLWDTADKGKFVVASRSQNQIRFEKLGDHKKLGGVDKMVISNWLILLAGGTIPEHCGLLDQSGALRASAATASFGRNCVSRAGGRSSIKRNSKLNTFLPWRIKCSTRCRRVPLRANMPSWTMHTPHTRATGHIHKFDPEWKRARKRLSILRGAESQRDAQAPRLGCKTDRGFKSGYRVCLIQTDHSRRTSQGIVMVDNQVEGVPHPGLKCVCKPRRQVHDFPGERFKWLLAQLNS